ncbi:MAG: hypothetical protein ACE37K_18210 [Planctomycetota bacterium]
MSRRLGLVLVFAVAGMAIGWRLMSPGPGDGERKGAEVIAQDAGSTSPGDSAREHGYDIAEVLAFAEGALGPADGVAEPVSEGAALDQQDAEWPELPRGWSLAFEMALACNPAFTARPLFRSYELNPRDVYIPPEDRKLLTSALDALRPRLAEGQKVWSRAYSEAFQEALASGAVRELDVNLRGGQAETASGNVAVTSISIEELQAAGADMGTVRGGAKSSVLHVRTSP